LAKRSLVMMAGLVLYACASHKEPVKHYSSEITLFPIKQDGKWGYIDNQGKIVIPPQYQQAAEFSEGLAQADDAFIDAEGHVAIDLSPLTKKHIQVSGPFSEGLALVIKMPSMTSADDAYPFFGFINQAGEIAIPIEYYQAKTFSDGVANVAIRKDYFYINPKGEIVARAPALVPPITSAEDFGEGLAPGHLAGNRGSEWGYYDRTGNTVIPPKFLYALPFSEGLAVATVFEQGRSMAGYIDKTGSFVIKPQFIDADEFSEGVAAVQRDRFWEFIDKQGLPVNSYHSEEKPGKYRGGLSQFKSGNKIGYINKFGKVIWEPTE
jgi:hypothetical protein